jgi:hypothetical protein
MDMYSHRGLDLASCKVGPVGHTSRPTWQGLRPMRFTWPEFDRDDLGLTFY